jgi:hypothetical protein
MRVNESSAVVRMVVTAVNITHTSIGQSQARDYLAKLKQKTHWLATLLADSLMRVLNEQRVTTYVGNVRCLQVVAIYVRTKDLRKQPAVVAGEATENLRDGRHHLA